MDPFTLFSLIGSGVNLIGNLAGPNETMPEQINPLTDGYYQNVLAELARWNQQQNQATQNAERSRQDISRAGNRAQSYEEQTGMLQRPGINDWFDNWMDEQLPGIREESARVAEASTRGGMAGQRERADQLSADAARSAAGQFAGSGGMFSGAMGNAVGEGAAGPLAEYEAQLGEQYQNAFMGAYSPLSSGAQNLAYQSSQNAFQNAMNQLGQQLNAAQLGGNLAGTSMQGALGQANLAGQRAQGAEGYRHDVAQPVWASPTYTPNMMQSFGQGMMDLSAFMPNGGGGGDYNIPGRDEYAAPQTSYNFGNWSGGNSLPDLGYLSPEMNNLYTGGFNYGN